MTGEILFVFGLLLVTILLFVSGFFRLDVVAIVSVVKGLSSKEIRDEP